MHRQFISAGQGRQLAYARNFISITIINLDGIHLLFCLRLWSSNQVRWNRYRPAINSNATYWTLSREKNVRWLSKIHVCKNKHNLLEILFCQGDDASDGIWGLLSKNMPPCWREAIWYRPGDSFHVVIPAVCSETASICILLHCPQHPSLLPPPALRFIRMEATISYWIPRNSVGLGLLSLIGNFFWNSRLIAGCFLWRSFTANHTRNDCDARRKRTAANALLLDVHSLLDSITLRDKLLEKPTMRSQAWVNFFIKIIAQSSSTGTCMLCSLDTTGRGPVPYYEKAWTQRFPQVLRAW